MWRPDPAFRRGFVGASSLDFLGAVVTAPSASAASWQAVDTMAGLTSASDGQSGDLDGEADVDLVTSRFTPFGYRLNTGGSFGPEIRIAAVVAGGDGRCVALTSVGISGRARSLRGDLGVALTRLICLHGRRSSPVETEAFVSKEGSCAPVSGGEWPSSE